MSCGESSVSRVLDGVDGLQPLFPGQLSYCYHNPNVYANSDEPVFGQAAAAAVCGRPLDLGLIEPTAPIANLQAPDRMVRAPRIEFVPGVMKALVIAGGGQIIGNMNAPINIGPCSN